MKVSRRRLLQQCSTTGLVLLAGAVGCQRREPKGAIAPNSTSDISTTANPACLLTPQQTEGPFYFDPRLVRQDITDGKPGIPLQLVLTLVNAATCKPLSNVRVDVWHADAEGLYSGYPGQGAQRNIDTTGQQFLRGIQSSDAQGQVSFATIYPGWYPGRVTHIHFKVFLSERRGMTSQLYFPPQTNQRVYRLPPYDVRGPGDTPEEKDLVLLFDGGGEQLHLQIDTLPGDHYRASYTIGLAV